ncbi:MAG: hypothetical protein PHI51_00985 [Candidatus Peribacteraceae bacterium]|nr:hypothetical protein [Candidatus Peribacteraceae bacterium]
MYPLGTLLSFGRSLPSEEDRTKFLAAIEGIGEEQRIVHRGIVAILGGTVGGALEQAGIGHLSRQLAQHWLDFTSADDLSGVRRN